MPEVTPYRRRGEIRSPLPRGNENQLGMSKVVKRVTRLRGRVQVSWPEEQDEEEDEISDGE